MPEILRDPAWQFVGVMLAALALIIPIVLFFVQRGRKALVYEVISQTEILSAAEEVAGKLQILFQGEPVSKVHLLVVRLINTGNTPITSDDYEREVSLQFTNSEKILSAEISETNPSNLSAEINLKEENIVLRPVLLNAGDSVVVKTLISGFSGDIEVDGRIVGVKSIEKRTDSLRWSFALVFVGSIILLVGFMTFFQNLPRTPFEGIPVGSIVLMTVGYMMLLVAIAARNRAFRKLLLAYFFDKA